MLNLRGGAHKRLRPAGGKRAAHAVLYARLSGFYSFALSSAAKYCFLI